MASVSRHACHLLTRMACQALTSSLETAFRMSPICVRGPPPVLFRAPWESRRSSTASTSKSFENVGGVFAAVATSCMWQTVRWQVPPARHGGTRSDGRWHCHHPSHQQMEIRTKCSCCEKWNNLGTNNLTRIPLPLPQRSLAADSKMP